MFRSSSPGRGSRSAPGRCVVPADRERGGAAPVTQFSTASGGKPPEIVDPGPHEAGESDESARVSPADGGQPVDNHGAAAVSGEPGDAVRDALAAARGIARGAPG